jgi:hypothetical protein
MQLGAVLVFDAGPLSLRHGGIDVERLRAFAAKRIGEWPRASERRTRLAFGSLEVFRSDADFQLDYHVRHACLPRPGDERALKRLAARVFSQALDPDKPLWELWIVEGLDAGRFALIGKCDSALLEPEARAAGGLLRAGEALARGLASAAAPSRALARMGSGVRFALDLAEEAFVTPDAALGRAHDGPHRRLDWLALAGEDVAAIRARLGGSERDVVLAALAGGLRRAAERPGARADVGALRVVTPFRLGGRVSAPRFRLPVDAPDARARLVSVRAASERYAPGAPASEESPLHELAELSQAAAGRRADVAALELASLDAPPALLGARLQSFVPVPPRLPGMALEVTLTRVADRMSVSLCSDASRVPDLAPLADAVAASFDELRRAAAQPPARKGRAARRARRGRSAGFEAEA